MPGLLTLGPKPWRFGINWDDIRWPYKVSSAAAVLAGSAGSVVYVERWRLDARVASPENTSALLASEGAFICGVLLSGLLALLMLLFGAHAAQRADADALLARSEGIYRSAFERAMVGMFMCGLDVRLIRSNAVFADMLGRDVDAMGGMLYQELQHPGDFGISAAAADRVLAGEISGYRAQRRFLHADGTTVYVELAASLICDGNDRPLKFAVQTVDVTTRRLAERELRTQDRMLESVIAHSPSLVYVKDLAGRYLLVNRPFERATSLSAAEIIGKDDSYFDPDLAPTWRINDLHAQREEFRIDEFYDGPNGRSLYESVKFPLRDSDDVVYATCNISLDVTDQRLAAEQTAAALAAAVAATTAKSSFLATMSHEIRTPLNAVIGMTGLLLDTELDPQQLEFAETVRTSGDALLAVINDILDFSKLEANGVELERATFELQACIDDAMALVAGAADGVDLVVDIDDRCPQLVRGDMHRLRQVIVNLAANAIKFTKRGEVVVSIRPTGLRGDLAADRGGTRLRFEVRDTGIGIPADRLDRLFKSFSQVDASTTREYGGTGLGLAICQGIVEAMGGRLTVTSTVGVGSTFSFDALFEAAPEGALPRQSAPWLGADLTGRRALLVDDNDTNRRVLRLQMEGWGVRCIDVSSGADALDIMAGGAQFDLSVIDMHMPEMAGNALARRIRTLDAYAGLPLLLLTSLGSGPATSLFDAFLTKPTRASLLRSTIAGLLGAAGEMTDAAPGPTTALGGVAAKVRATPLRVLLVEDNQVNQLVGRRMLNKLGHVVDIAGNGQEALDRIAGARYDVVLMDVHMPVMDGLEATRAIRLGAEGQPCIIAMTASSLESDRRECVDAGMDGYLLKPVQLAHLSLVLSAVGDPDVDRVDLLALTT